MVYFGMRMVWSKMQGIHALGELARFRFVRLFEPDETGFPGNPAGRVPGAAFRARRGATRAEGS